MCALDADGGARGGVGQGVSGGVTDALTAVKSWNWTNGFLSTTVFFVLRCKKKVMLQITHRIRRYIFEILNIN